MEISLGKEIISFVMLAALAIVVIEQLHKQTVLAQLISAGLVVMLSVVYIITIHELERND